MELKLDINKLFELLIVVLGFVYWIAGFVIAKGVWSTFFCIIPFYAWYLVIERLMFPPVW